MYNLYNRVLPKNATQADLNEEERALDAARLAENGAYRQGYFKGFVDGTAQGYAKGWADAMKKVKDEQAQCYVQKNGVGY